MPHPSWASPASRAAPLPRNVRPLWACTRRWMGTWQPLGTALDREVKEMNDAWVRTVLTLYICLPVSFRV